MIGIKGDTLRVILCMDESDNFDLSDLYDLLMEGCTGWRRMSPATISECATIPFDIKEVSFSTKDDYYWYEALNDTEEDIIEQITTLICRELNPDEVIQLTKEEYNMRGY